MPTPLPSFHSSVPGKNSPAPNFSFRRDTEEWSVHPAFQLLGGPPRGLVSVMPHLVHRRNWHSMDAWMLPSPKKSEGWQPAASAAGRQKREASFCCAIFSQDSSREWYLSHSLVGSQHTLDVWGPLGPREWRHPTAAKLAVPETGTRGSKRLAAPEKPARL